MSNHVDGEIYTPKWAPPTASTQPFDTRVPSVPSDLEYRTAALNAAVNLAAGKANRAWVVDVAQGFEDYLRTGEAA